MTDKEETRGVGGRRSPEDGEEHGAMTVGKDTDIAEPESIQVEELRAELDLLNDRHLRLAAEFDNYRKRHERDRQRQAAHLQLDLVSSFLDVLDDLERVTGPAAAASGEAVLEGVRLVEKKFRSVLEQAGLDPVEAAEGTEFDPSSMEAIQVVPSDDPDRDHRVADVFQRGYRFRDVLVRPARVRVYQHQDRVAGEGSA